MIVNAVHFARVAEYNRNWNLSLNIFWLTVIDSIGLLMLIRKRPLSMIKGDG
jgi:hypothetical protein